MLHCCAAVMLPNAVRLRARTKNAAENLAMLRHVVLNVLQLDKTLVGGTSSKCKELSWDDKKRLKLIVSANQEQ